jgi:hypothetical protein
MTAVNAIQSLGNSSDLPIEEATATGAIEARGAVSQAVNGIGFDPFFPGNDLAVQDFEERLQQIFGQQPAEVADFTTVRGENVQFAVSSSEGAVVLKATAKTAIGHHLPVKDITVMNSAGGSHASIAEGRVSLDIHAFEENAVLDLALDNGYVVQAEIEFHQAGRHSEIRIDAREIENTTFSAQTESLVFAKDVEASKLLKAIGG